MTARPPRPGAHGERIPDDSHAFIAECGHEPIIPIGIGVAYVDPCPKCGGKVTFLGDPRNDDPLVQYHRTWPDPRKFPDPSRRRLQTVTVEITMEVKGDLTRHINSALASIPTAGGRKEWVYLGEH